MVISPLPRRPGVYLAGPLGFTDAGRIYHDDVIRPAVSSLGVDVLDPWPAAESILAREVTHSGSQDLIESLTRANELIGTSNQEMIEASTAVLAVLDGADVDSGTAAEVGFACAIGRPIVGLRTDLRMSGDNFATSVNLQVAHFVRSSGGEIVRTVEEALDRLKLILG